MNDERIKVIVKRPDEEYGHVTRMNNTLSAFQKAVGGHIETVGITPYCVCICNEEGKLRGLERNFKKGRVPFQDVIVGTAVIVGVDGEEFTDCPLDFKTWKMLLAEWGNM